MRHAHLFTAGLALASLALAQEPKPGPKPEPKPEAKPQEHELELPALTAPNDDQQEMIRLFHEVERNLHNIDVELFDASAGRIPVPEGKDSGIEKLLTAHGQRSDQVVSGMEKILELAQKMGGGGGGT